MHDEVDTFTSGHADSEQTACLVGADEHDEAFDIEHSDRVAVGRQHVVVADPVPACARQDRRIRLINLP
ncbi:MAG TPA: hypothetical protein VMX37_00765 [Acidimicrobiia bacterium]|nr:hypothetical protein [Acidimicrobiia bacterium]